VSGISLTLFWRFHRVVIDIRVYITAVGRDIRFGNSGLLTLGNHRDSFKGITAHLNFDIPGSFNHPFTVGRAKPSTFIAPSLHDVEPNLRRAHVQGRFLYT
jgi:hypothetical protein